MVFHGSRRKRIDPFWLEHFNMAGRIGWLFKDLPKLSKPARRTLRAKARQMAKPAGSCAYDCGGRRVGCNKHGF